MISLRLWQLHLIQSNSISSSLYSGVVCFFNCPFVLHLEATEFSSQIAPCNWETRLPTNLRTGQRNVLPLWILITIETRTGTEWSNLTISFYSAISQAHKVQIKSRISGRTARWQSVMDKPAWKKEFLIFSNLVSNLFCARSASMHGLMTGTDR